MKLYGHDTSPYVRRARVLLAELGLPFVRDTENWASPQLASVNPLLRVPVLLDEDGGQVLFDSRLIADYLYTRRRPTALPAPPPGRAPLQGTLFRPDHRYDDENLLLTLDGALDSAINVFLLERDGVDRAAAPYLERQVARVRSCLSHAERVYGDRDTLGEGALSFVDIALCCALDWMTFRQRYDVTAHPGLVRVLERHRGRPSLAETHPSLAQVQAAPSVR